MTAKEKAIELVDKMFDVDLGDDEQETSMNYSHAIKCALIAVDEMINSCPLEPTDVDWDDAGGTHQYWYESRQDKAINFWQEVKKEIEAL